MVSNKLVGLAALVLMAGSMGFSAVGCSSSDAADDDDDGGTSSSSGSSGTRPQPTDGGSSGNADQCTPATPDAEYFTSYPAATTGGQGSCTAAEIAAIKAVYAGDFTSVKQLTDAVSATCGSCFALGVGDDVDVPSPAPLYVYLSSDPTRGFLNEGFCAGNVSTPDCGKVVAATNTCAADSCAQGTNCEDDLEGCEADVNGDDESACSTVGADALSQNCTQEQLQKVIDECFTAPNNTFDVWINTACGPTGSGDGGASSSGGSSSGNTDAGE